MPDKIARSSIATPIKSAIVLFRQWRKSQQIWDLMYFSRVYKCSWFTINTNLLNATSSYFLVPSITKSVVFYGFLFALKKFRAKRLPTEFKEKYHKNA
jgi:hypothetical protein